MIKGEGGEAKAFEADITREADCHAFAEAALAAYGRIDVLHNNVGIGGGDGGPTSVTEEVLQRIFDVNLKGTLFSCKHVLPILRKQLSGSIINISSVAAVCSVGIVAYKASKAAVNALTHSIAMGNARYGIRANVIMPGLMNTPMAIEGISAARGISKQQLIAERDARVPLGGKMGTRLGRRLRRAVSRLRRGAVHHRRDAAGRRRAERADRLVSVARRGLLETQRQPRLVSEQHIDPAVPQPAGPLRAGRAVAPRGPRAATLS